MTSLRNMAVSDSAIYRGIYQRHREDPLLGSFRRGAAEEETSKWAFLKRLLEIEEVHDKRRKAKEKQERALKQASMKPVTSSGNTQPMEEGTKVDHSAKWLSSQVSTSTAPELDSRQSGLEGRGSHRFPPVSGQVTPNSFRSHQEHDDHRLMKANDSHASRINSADNENRQGDSYGHPYHVSISGLKTSSHTNDRDDVRHSLSSAEQLLIPNHDGDAGLSSFQRVPSRQTSALKRHRQLRLPPILPPRVYTVQPRPLKALKFPAPTKLPGPITETEWEDLHDCRYIRHITPRKSFNL